VAASLVFVAQYCWFARFCFAGISVAGMSHVLLRAIIVLIGLVLSKVSFLLTNLTVCEDWHRLIQLDKKGNQKKN
jgi:hypothetical protein